MNIVVVGAGGVGGYFGGKLAHAGFDVTFIARGKTLQAIKLSGLKVKSVNGDFVVHPKTIEDIKELINPDLVILGVKSWQIEPIAKELKEVISKKTMVLPLQNGADNADRLRNILPHENVLAGLCKIVSKIEAPGVINHFAFEPKIVFGEFDSKLTSRVKKVKSVFDKAGFKSTISENIQLDIWEKFLFITTISGIGAITRVVYGEIRKDDYLRQIMYQTANEIVAIANAKGVALTNSDIEMTLKIIDGFNHGTTASMQRDFMAGRPSELENFNGYIVKQGKELHVLTPANSFIYHCLLPQERKARGLS
ncbi:2-dehydropantoate 2-reductase [Flavobacteriaceae bacterium S0862]|nr:2-dehydropantoate 2-reductase [Flavobacteriaceae bacterium S0862]